MYSLHEWNGKWRNSWNVVCLERRGNDHFGWSSEEMTTSGDRLRKWSFLVIVCRNDHSRWLSKVVLSYLIFQPSRQFPKYLIWGSSFLLDNRCMYFLQKKLIAKGGILEMQSIKCCYILKCSIQYPREWSFCIIDWGIITLRNDYMTKERVIYIYFLFWEDEV